MNDQEKLIADLTTERDNAQRALASQKESNECLIKSNDQFKLEIHGLETQRGELRGQIASLESDNTKLRGDIATLQASYNALKADSETAEYRAAKMVAQFGIVRGPIDVTGGAPAKTLTQRAIEAKAASQKSQ